MAIKINNTTVINDSRGLENISNLKTVGGSSVLGTGDINALSLANVQIGLSETASQNFMIAVPAVPDGTITLARGNRGATTDNVLTIDSSNNLTAIANVTAYSDARLKTDIARIENALEKVSSLNGYTYTRTDTNQRQTGLIAQEVKQVLPEAVIDGEHLSLAYGNMIGLLVEAIKEQQKQIEELKEVVKSLT